MLPTSATTRRPIPMPASPQLDVGDTLRSAATAQLCTQTSEPMGMRLAFHTKSMNVVVTRTQPCDAGTLGIRGAPWTATPPDEVLRPVQVAELAGLPAVGELPVHVEGAHGRDGRARDAPAVLLVGLVVEARRSRSTC